MKSNVTFKKVQKKRVQVAKKEEVLTLAATGKSQRAISRDTGVSLTTVNKIINTDIDELEQYRTQKKLEFINKSWETVNNALEYGNQKTNGITMIMLYNKIRKIVQQIRTTIKKELRKSLLQMQ